MKSIVAIVVVGILGFAVTAFNPALEMWGPLIVWLVPLMALVMWPARDDGAEKPRETFKSAA